MKGGEMFRTGVALSIGSLPLKGQVEEILSVLDVEGPGGLVVLCGHSGLDQQGSQDARTVAELYPTRVFLALAESGSWSAGYLLGIKKASELGADFIISMDADGSHDPKDLPRFISTLKSHQVVMSSRFMPDAVNAYPLQRKVVSWLGTMLTRIFLTRYPLTDFTSGYEGIRSEVAWKIFNKHPIEEWVCVKVGPYHLQNTELRLAIIREGYDIREIPISYGVKRTGKTFSFGFLFKAFVGFVFLLSRRLQAAWKRFTARQAQ